MADNVIKKVIDMRKGKTAILPSIVTNPELTGEEESLKSVEINGTNFTIGGSNTLKLVATGTYDSGNESFLLDNTLEENKSYLLKFTYDIGGECSIYTSILNIYNMLSKTTNFWAIPIMLPNEESEMEFYQTCIDNSLNEIFTIGSSGLFINNLVTLEIYELPYSL